MRWTQGLFDELARAGREHLDAAYVGAYDRKAGFDADAADEVRLLCGLGLSEHSTLVDLGAGTGALALAAAAICRRVVAVDISPEMVIATKEKVAALGVSNVECVQAGFLSYEHEGAPADFVYSRLDSDPHARPGAGSLHADLVMLARLGQALSRAQAVPLAAERPIRLP